MKKIMVALLTGGISSEDYLSRRSCANVCGELDSDRYDFFILNWQQDGSVFQSALNNPEQHRLKYTNILSCFADFQGDVVFNTLHGEQESCGQIQGLLELAGIPVTGNGLSSSVLGMDKQKSKICFTTLAIPTPKGIHLPIIDNIVDDYPFHSLFKKSGLRYPLIMKPVKGGSSDGIVLIKDESDLAAKNEMLVTTNKQRQCLVEEFIQGTDVSVGIFSLASRCSHFQQTHTLPVAKINYKGEFFSKSLKHNEKFQVSFPFDLPHRLISKMEKAALTIHRHFKLTGFSRTDFIITSDEVFTLEVNTHPGLASSSIIPQMLHRAGLSKKNLYGQMIDCAITRSTNIPPKQ